MTKISYMTDKKWHDLTKLSAQGLLKKAICMKIGSKNTN